MDQLSTDNEDQLELEDELPEDFEVEEQEDGSANIVPPSDDEQPDAEDDFWDNLADTDKQNFLDSAQLNRLASDYLEFIEIDKKAREKRDKQYADAIRRTGLGDDAPGGADFEGSSEVVHPMMAESAIEFASAASKELFPADGPVRTKIEGRVTPKKLQKADRKRRHMNWQLKNQILEFKPFLEQTLTQASLSGVQYTKMYYWARGRRPKFEYVPMDDIYVPFHAASFYAAERKTHRQRLTRQEFEERVDSGLYLADVDLDLTDAMNMNESAAQKANDKVEGKEDPMYDEDGIRTVYEVYCWLNIEDPLIEGDYSWAPYIMTIDDPTQRVIGLYRNWDPEENTYEPLDWIIEWSFIPWRGAYAIGFYHLIGGLSKAATGALRALLDSAHINNSPTAIKLKGAQFSGQSANINVTQIHEIDAAPGIDDIRKIAMPLPFNPPSPVLFELLGFLTNASKSVVKTVIETDPEYSPNMAPGTQYNMIEQGLKVYSSIHSRMHDSLSRVLGILHRLNKQHLENSAPDEEEAHLTDLMDEVNEQLAFKTDYEGEIDVQPVSDPNIFSDSQRFAQMTAIGQLVDRHPTLYDVRAYNKAMLQLMKAPNIDQLLPDPEGIKDENPVTENIKMATGAPAGVLPDQDHLAHIQVHMDFMNSPTYGGNPAIMPALAAQWVSHMIQHMLMLYGSEMKDLIEKSAGMKITEMLDEATEVREALSKAAAAASPLAIESATSLLQQVVPKVAEVMNYVQSIQPPMPMDPTAVAAQDVQIKGQMAQQKAQADAAKAQNDQAKIQADLQKTQIKAQVDSSKEQNKAQIENAKNQTKLTEARIRADVELEKNEEDNQTAMTIAGMRAIEGNNVGNLKNGNSIDQNFKDGGLVTKQGE